MRLSPFSPSFQIRPALARLAEGMAALAYPSLCYGCEVRLRDPRDALCPSCLRGLPRADRGSAAALFEASPVDHVVAVWAFDAGGTVRRVQHALKYGGRPVLGRQLGRLIGAAVRETGATPDGVVPLPLARLRQLERGYNQAEALAAGVAQALDRPVLNVLIRTRATLRQATLSAEARRHNVDGAFQLAAGAEVRGQRLLLVDDVITTGATVDAAARPLLAAGARVDVAALSLAGT